MRKQKFLLQINKLCTYRLLYFLFPYGQMVVAEPPPSPSLAEVIAEEQLLEAELEALLAQRVTLSVALGGLDWASEVRFLCSKDFSRLTVVPFRCSR